MLPSTSSRLRQGPTHVMDTGRCPTPCPNPTEVARLGQLSLCCSRSGASPSSWACSVLSPALWLSRAAVCAATELSVRCSQDLFNLRTPSVLHPDRRGEPVVTVVLCPHRVLSLLCRVCVLIVSRVVSMSPSSMWCDVTLSCPIAFPSSCCVVSSLLSEREGDGGGHECTGA